MRRTWRGPRVRCLRRGDERWRPTAGEARAPCVVFSQWQLRGSQREVQIRWFPLRWMVDSVAAALWRQVLLGGGMLGAGLSVSLVFLSVLDRALVATSHTGEGCLSHRLGLARPALPRGVVLTTLQSNRSGPLEVVSSFSSR